MLNDDGKFIEDCILYRTGPNAWLVVHGSGAGHETIAAGIAGRNVAMLFDDDLHDLSRQGRRRRPSSPVTCRVCATGGLAAAMP